MAQRIVIATRAEVMAAQALVERAQLGIDPPVDEATAAIAGAVRRGDNEYVIVKEVPEPA